MLKFLLKTARVSILAPVALPLFASVTGQAQSVRIDISDLDLSKPAHLAVMNGRIEHAAEKYCGGLDVQDLPHRDACRSAFRAEALDQIRDYRLQRQAARSPRVSHDAG